MGVCDRENGAIGTDLDGHVIGAAKHVFGGAVAHRVGVVVEASTVGPVVLRPCPSMDVS